MPTDDISEIGSSRWLTDPDGSETKFHYGQSPAGYYYAVDSAPQDDERDYLCWVGPYVAREQMEDAAWATRDDDNLQALLDRPGIACQRRSDPDLPLSC